MENRKEMMSILDSVMSAVEQHSEVNQEQHSSLVQSALQMFGSHAGLSSVVNNAESQGVGHVVQSWIGTGANQPIAPQQLQAVLGQDKINQLASRAGIPPAIASVALSRILPTLVDKLTPNGKLPQAP
jgi:uncharacterized protein YidB (DUF937 family)